MVSSTKRERRNAKDETTFRSGSSWLLNGKLGLLALVILASTAIASCASKQVYIPIADRAALEKEQNQGADAVGGASASAEAGRDGVTVQDLSEGATRGRVGNDPKGSNLIKDIYFDFDSYKLKGEDFDGLKKLSGWLKTHSRSNLTVEGHCDERGSIEYNMALGQKRADAIKEYLLTTGVEQGGIKTISYGKEAPSDGGHTEEAWAKNRRAHMKID